MQLLEQIKADYREALRLNDSHAAQTIGSLIRAACDCSDQELRRIIERLLQRIRAERSPSIKLTQLMQGYLSNQHLSDDDITTIAVRQHSIRSVPQILQYLRANYAGRYDPKRAVTIVRELTS